MSEEHVAIVTYHGNDDHIWLTCSCGWSDRVDFYPTLQQVNQAWDRHLLSLP